MSQDDLKVANVKKIAVLRANALGDFIVTLPALQAIRVTYPEAEIILLGKQWHQSFLIKGRTPVDRVIIVPVKKGIREEKGVAENASEVAAFYKTVQQEQLDIVINFQGNGISANPFIKQLGAKLTVGLTSPKSEPLDRSIDFYYYQNEMIRYMEVAQLIGAAPVTLEPEVNVLETDKEAIKNFLGGIGHKPYVVLHPITTDIRRTWPIENYPAVADALANRGYEIIFSGSLQDKEAIDTIISKMKHPALNSCGAFGLDGLVALLSNAAVVIGADTGPIHLARAVNAPTVGIYWAPNVLNWGPLTRKLHRPVISWQLQCPYCGEIPNNPYPFEPQTTCTHNVSFVRDITVEDVLQAADALLPQKFVEQQKRSEYISI